MNSKELKKKYHNEYKIFFTEHNIILSIPLIMNRSRDIRAFDWVSIKQKIPLRIYWWIKKNDSGKIILNNITKQNIYTDEKEDHIKTTEIKNYAPYIQEIEEYLNKNHKNLIQQYGGIEINIFSEVNRWIGLGYDQIFTMLISSLIHRLNNELTEEGLTKIKKETINNTIISNKTFQSILEEGRRISTIISWYWFSWDKITSFFSWYYPVVTNTTRISKKWEEEKYQYNWFKLNELFEDLPEIPYTPIDFGLIFSWQPTYLEQILWTYENYT